MERLDVTILDREYSFACTPDGRDTLQAAVQHVDRMMFKLKQQTKPGTSAERIAIMVAVQLAVELLATPVGDGNQGEFALGDYKRKIGELQQLVDSAISRHSGSAVAASGSAGTSN